MFFYASLDSQKEVLKYNIIHLATPTTIGHTFYSFTLIGQYVGKLQVLALSLLMLLA
jgi:hypothetical protein